MTAAASRKDWREMTLSNDLVTIRRVTVERQVNAKDWVAEIMKSRPLDSGILPVGCVRKIVSPAKPEEGLLQQTLYILQMPARVMPVQYKPPEEYPGLTDEEQQNPDLRIRDLKLSVPNTLWFFPFSGGALQDTFFFAATMEPLMANGGKTKLLYLPVPNQFPEGNVCLGNLRIDQGVAEEKRCEMVMDYMHSSLWNKDLPPYWKDDRGNYTYGVKDLFDWHDRTVGKAAKPSTQTTDASPEIPPNAEFWRELKYKPHKKGATVDDAIARLLPGTANG